MQWDYGIAVGGCVNIAGAILASSGIFHRSGVRRFAGICLV
jgi:hypothetical protein